MHAYDRVIPCASPRCDWRFFVALPRPGLACPLCEERVTTVSSLPRVFIQKHKPTDKPDDYEENILKQHWVVGWPGRTLHDWHIRDTTPFHVANTEPDRTPRAEFAYDAGSDTWYLVNRGVAGMRFRHTDDAPWENWTSGTKLQIHDGMRLQFGEFGPAPTFNRALVKIDRLDV